MIRRFLIAFSLLLPLGVAVAQVSFVPLGPEIPAGAAYQGVGDVVSGWNAYWGLRAYNAAYAASLGNAAILKRASDSTTQTITVLSNGNFDTATASTFCNATTCVVTQLYDQTGNGNNMTVPACCSAPPFAFSCIGSLPCLQPNGVTAYALNAGPVSTQSQPFTLLYGGVERTGRFTTDMVIMGGSTSATNPDVEFNSSANSMLIFAGTNVSQSATDSTLHCVQAVFNGASSIFSIDNSNTTVSPGTRGIKNIFLFLLGSGSSFLMQGNWFEGGFYTSGLTTGNNTSLYNNQHAYGLC